MKQVKFMILFAIFLCACASQPPASLPKTAETELNGEPMATESSLVKTATKQKALTEVVIQNPDTETNAITEHYEVEPLTEVIATTEDVFHTVVPGDTVYSLARKYETTPENIIVWNGLPDPDMLELGQSLVVGAHYVETVVELVEPVTEKDHTFDTLTEGLDNSPYGWSYPASVDIESFINKYHAYSRIPAPNHQLILTFDCGYNYGNYVNRILDILEEKDVEAAFFITGSFLHDAPDTVHRMIADGHTVGNHTMMHLNGPEAIDKEGIAALVSDLRNLEEEYTTQTGTTIAKIARPPEGVWSEQMLSVYDHLGYTSFFWDLAYRDWEVENQMDPQDALRILKEQTRDGAVILLHAVSETNSLILGDYIDWAKSEGYRFVTTIEITN